MSNGTYLQYVKRIPLSICNIPHAWNEAKIGFGESLTETPSASRNSETLTLEVCLLKMCVILMMWHPPPLRPMSPQSALTPLGFAVFFSAATVVSEGLRILNVTGVQVWSLSSVTLFPNGAFKAFWFHPKIWHCWHPLAGAKQQSNSQKGK